MRQQLQGQANQRVMGSGQTRARANQALHQNLYNAYNDLNNFNQMGYGANYGYGGSLYGGVPYGMGNIGISGGGFIGGSIGGSAGFRWP